MTVRRFFFGRRRPEGQVGRRLGRGDQIAELRDKLGAELGKTRWKLVAKEIGKQVAAVLDFGVAEKVLGPAWQRLQLLQEYRDPEKHPAEELSLVPLLEHSVKSTHKPHIDLMVKEVEIGRLTLAVDLAFELEGIVLRVQEGRIRGVEAGSATGRGSLACHYGESSIYKLERKSRRFRLDTGIGFGDGLAIPPLDPDLDPFAN